MTRRRRSLLPLAYEEEGKDAHLFVDDLDESGCATNGGTVVSGSGGGSPWRREAVAPGNAGLHSSTKARVCAVSAQSPLRKLWVQLGASRVLPRALAPTHREVTKLRFDAYRTVGSLRRAAPLQVIQKSFVLHTKRTQDGPKPLPYAFSSCVINLA